MDLSNDVVIHQKKNGIEYLQFRKLLEYPNIKHAYVLKPLDFRTHKENDITQNYDLICNELGTSVTKIVRPIQKHTNVVERIDKKQNEDKPDINMNYLESVDGLITSSNNLMLATTNADCILLLFYDPVKNVVGNVHSGWRGTFKKIASNTIKKMVNEFECNPSDIMVFICPSIRKCHFEVEDDVKLECENIFGYTGRLNEIIKYGEVKEGKQKYFIDTVLITKIILNEEGINPLNIYDAGICSLCNYNLIHSRRGDGEDYGLGTALIMRT